MSATEVAETPAAPPARPSRKTQTAKKETRRKVIKPADEVAVTEPEKATETAAKDEGSAIAEPGLKTITIMDCDVPREVEVGKELDALFGTISDVLLKTGVPELLNADNHEALMKTVRQASATCLGAIARNINIEEAPSVMAEMSAKIETPTEKGKPIILKLSVPNNLESISAAYGMIGSPIELRAQQRSMFTKDDEPAEDDENGQLDLTAADADEEPDDPRGEEATDLAPDDEPEASETTT